MIDELKELLNNMMSQEEFDLEFKEITDMGFPKVYLINKKEMMTNRETVHKWLETAGKVSPSNPKFPDSETFNLILKLLLEELTELAESGNKIDMCGYRDILKDSLNRIENACYQPDKERDLTEYRDAVTDLCYVLHNSTYFAGLREQFDEDFDEVTRSNFSKFCDTESDAIKSVDTYAAKGIKCHYKSVNGYYVIYRSEDMKILKGVNFSEVNFKPL